MDWVKLSTRFYLDPEVASLPDADAELMFVRGLAYCGAEETRGFIPASIVPSLTRRRRHGAAVEALVARSLWVPSSGDRGQPGYRIARWEDWQEELEALAQRRAADRERKRRERGRKAGESAGSSRDMSRDTLPVENRSPETPAPPPASASPQVSGMSRDVSAGNQSQSQKERKEEDRPARDGPRLVAVEKLADHLAHDEDDDEVLSTVIRSMKTRTGQRISAIDARRIAAGIIGSAKRHVGNPGPYIEKAIMREKDPVARWLKQPEVFHQSSLMLPVNGGHAPEPPAPLPAGTGTRTPGAAEHWAGVAREEMARRAAARQSEGAS